ncbi:cellulose synthase-like protein G3 [Tanacetum coccineum]
MATTTLLISDIILAFMWATTTSIRLRPIIRQVYPENLKKTLSKKDYPSIDIFICTADPYKEPPMNVVNTALSLMAYDYPPEKLSVYVSDDGGSKLTFFALSEAAKFAKIWLPFCRDNNIVDRCPEAYFSSHYHGQDEFDSQEIQAIYDVMKIKVETVVERGEVYPEYISDEQQQHTFNKYRTSGFTRSNHPAIIEVHISFLN